MVFFRDAAGVVQAGLEGKMVDYRFSPVVSAIDKAAKVFVTGGKMLGGDQHHDLGDLGVDAVGAFGVLAGVPGASQAATTAGYLNRVRKGKERPQGPLEAAAGLGLGVQNRK